jgi:heat shock protein HslJ
MALLFLGFSLGFYVTNQNGRVELPTEAAFIEADEDALSQEDIEGVLVEAVLDDAPEANQSDVLEVITEEDVALEEDIVLREEVVLVEAVEPLATPSEPVVLAPTKQPLSGGVWKLATISGNSAAGDYQMFAKSGGRFGGETPCNVFYGAYGMSQSQVLVTDFGDTGVDCGSEEAIFLSTLASGSFAHNEQGDLVISSSRGDLVFIQ